MFKKKINASSNLKGGLHLGTKIKSNGGLNIGMEGVFWCWHLRDCLN